MKNITPTCKKQLVAKQSQRIFISTILILSLFTSAVLGFSQQLTEDWQPDEKPFNSAADVIDTALHGPAVVVPAVPEGSLATGDDCSNPIIINLPGDLPFEDLGNYTCGRGNTYSNSCMIWYDNGEDITYQLNVTAGVTVDFNFDPVDYHAGIAIKDDCGNAGSCLYLNTGVNNTARVFRYAFSPGTYYIMIDTYSPNTNCLTGFDLTISECINPFIYTSSSTFVAPAGVDIVTVQAWGGGGRGGDADGGIGFPECAGGGGGGAFSAGTASVSPSIEYTVTVGLGGSGSTLNGGDSWFGSVTTVLAKGGEGVAQDQNAGGPGGSDIFGYGNIAKYKGGEGGNVDGNYSGRGGGGAGTTGAGGDADSANNLIPGYGTLEGGGDGGDGDYFNGDGDNGQICGGGGGGACDDSSFGDKDYGGDGGRGQVIVSWSCPSYSLSSVSGLSFCGTITSITLNGLPEGTYTITYGTTNPYQSGLSASMNVYADGNGSFTATGLTAAAPSSSTITITHLSSGSTPGGYCCGNEITSNNTTTVNKIAGGQMNVYPGTALDFDGSDDGISTNIDVDPNAYPSMTWEAWVYPTRSNYGDWQFVFSNDDQGWDRTVAIPPNTSFWEVHTGIGPWNAVEIDLDTWQHIAVVFDDNNDSIFFYKNGKRYVYDGLSSFGSSNLKLNIGRSPEDQCYFQGKIDEVRIWDEIRTQQQIRESMHASIACNAAGLISYWNFNEGAGIQLFDAISGNNGTLINMENSDWTNSVIPFGIGFADSQTETNGTVAFTGTGLSMDFTSQNGAEITASRIDINPNLLPVSADIILDDQYWVVNRYDTSSFEADLSFTMAENLTAYDEVNPYTIILYSRPSISDNAWEFSATADSVNAAVNTATFSGITDFSQFIVAKGNPSHIALLTSYMFNSLSGNFNSIDVGQSSSPTFTDLDGDGLLDLIMGEYDGYLNHYEQDAINSVSFSLITASFNGIDVGSSSNPAFTDLNGDGLLDMIIGEGSGNLNHYEQDAINSSSFSLITESFNAIDVGAYSSPTFTDFDGDGLLDLIIGESIGNLNHYEQDAINAGSFSLITTSFNAIDIYNLSNPTFTDLDGDGLLDLIVGEASGNLNHYEQDAIKSGSFSLITESFNAIDVGYCSIPAFTDLDGDGMLDLIVGGNVGNLNHYEQEYIDVMDFGAVLVGNASFAKSYSISAYLVGDLLIECPEGYSISLSESSGYTNSLSIPRAGGSISVQVYVRFSPDSVTSYNGNLVHSSPGATTKNIALSGRGDLIEGFPGTALAFDGEDDYVQLSQVLDIGNVSSTFECWVKVPLVGTNNLDEGERVGILLGNNTNSSSVPSMNYEIHDDGQVRWYWNTGEVEIFGTTDLRDNQWHHLAFVRDKVAEMLTLYIDGAIEKTHDTIGTDLSMNTTQRIGCDNRTTTMPNFHGRIEECRVWNVARSEQQIRESMHLSLIGTESGLAGYWQLNDSAGTQAVDIISGNVGSLVYLDNTDWVASTIPFGTGYADSQTETEGMVAFAGTGLSMDFISQSGAEITAARIDLAPNLNPDGTTVLDEQYWVVNRYDTTSFEADLSFTMAEDLTTEDEYNPSGVVLYTRSSNSDSAWEVKSAAVSVNAAANTATFQGITDFSQFIVGKGSAPLITLMNPYINFLSGNFNSIDVGNYSNPTFTDLDGDGLLDLIIGEMNGNLNHYEQDAVNSSSFSLISPNFNAIDVGGDSSPSFTDLDGDGMLDLIVGEPDGCLYHYEQDAINSLSFTLISPNFNAIDVGDYSIPAFTDLNGDGLLDLIVGEKEGNLYHYEQDAVNSLSFTLINPMFNSIDVGDYSSPAFTDLNWDGLLDLIVGEQGGELYHFEQDTINSGSFSLITASFNAIDVGSCSIPAFTDLDGDGAMDLILGEDGGNLNHYELEIIDEMDFGPVPVGNNIVKMYTLGAKNLLNDLLIECPEGFSISLNESSGYTNSLSISALNGSINEVVYVRFNPDSATSYNGNLQHSSLEARSKNIALSGRGFLIDGFPGKTINFNGVDEYIQLSSILPVGSISSTFEFWVKVPLVGTNNLEDGERVGVMLSNYSNDPYGPTMTCEIHSQGADEDLLGAS